MKKAILSAIVLLTTIATNAQDNKKAEDVKAIKSMCGCFEIEFNFAEIFPTSKDASLQAVANEKTIRSRMG